MTEPQDASGWPIFVGSRVRVRPDRGLNAYSATVLRIFDHYSTVDGEEYRQTTLQVRRDKRDFKHLVSPEFCTVLKQSPKKTLPIRLDEKHDAAYKNPFPSDKEEEGK